MFLYGTNGRLSTSADDMSEMVYWSMGVAVAGLGYVTHYSIAPVFGSLQPCINL